MRCSQKPERVLDKGKEGEVVVSIKCPHLTQQLITFLCDKDKSFTYYQKSALNVVCEIRTRCCAANGKL